MSFHHSGVNHLATCMFCIHPLVICIQHSCNQTLLGYHRNTHETGVVCAKARQDILCKPYTLTSSSTLDTLPRKSTQVLAENWLNSFPSSMMVKAVVVFQSEKLFTLVHYLFGWVHCIICVYLLQITFAAVTWLSSHKQVMPIVYLIHVLLLHVRDNIKSVL